MDKKTSINADEMRQGVCQREGGEAEDERGGEVKDERERQRERDKERQRGTEREIETDRGGEEGRLHML